MSRVPLQELEEGQKNQLLAGVVESFAAEGRTPIDLHRALANSPTVLVGFHALSNALRYETAIPRALAETLILRTALLTRSEYEWEHHFGMALKAGVSQTEIRTIPNWQESDVFGEEARSALRLVDAIHRLEVDDETFGVLRNHFTNQQIVEMVVLISHYQAVSRITAALGIGVEPEYQQDPDDSQRVQASQAFAQTGGNG